MSRGKLYIDQNGEVHSARGTSQLQLDFDNHDHEHETQANHGQTVDNVAQHVFLNTHEEIENLDFDEIMHSRASDAKGFDLEDD